MPKEFDHEDRLDLSASWPIDSVPEGTMVTGRLGDKTILLYREKDVLHAFDATCPHLGGPLADGLVAGATVRCPWHHACFDLRTGEALSAPAFDALRRYEVKKFEGRWAAERLPLAAALPSLPIAGATGAPAMVIVGGGAAGFAAADAIRKEGWTGAVVLFSDDVHAPYDRTLLTKDYLDGKFGDDRLPIARHGLLDLGVRLELDAKVQTIDVPGRTIRLHDGRIQPFDKLLLATGATPRKPDVPGIQRSHVHVLRSLDDCRRILASTAIGRRIVVLGSSFIGLEAAASLRSRGFSVEVVSPDRHPMGKVFGRALSDVIVEAHRRDGVVLHLGQGVKAITADAVVLDDGSNVSADLVIVGLGVTPNIDLAEAAGLTCDDGILVDAHLQTSAPHVFAAGDVARWPDPHGGERLRVEHWVVAERQGQTAAANMLGAKRPFDMIPFFWTKHFDLSVRYVGHAHDWDEEVVEGDLSRRDAIIRFRRNGRDLAVASVGRDMDVMQAERLMAGRSR